MRPERFLERSLLFSWAIHGVAVLAMALVLMAGLPGGGNGPAERMAYVAGHTWAWRLGWIPWQLTALSNLLIAIALIRSHWAPRLAAWLGLLFTVAAILPEQTGELLFSVRAPIAAQAGVLADYAALESHLFDLTSAWGALFYAVAAACWSWSFATGGIWRKWMTPFSAVLWPLFAYISGGLLLPEPLRPSLTFVAAGNAVGFALLMLWFTVVTELVLRRSRPDGAHGRLQPWRCASGRWLGILVGLVANSRLLRRCFEWLPVVPMVSDIRDVIYVNYLVNAERLEPLLPEGLELQRIGPEGRFGLFTFLTFRHGHFGPRFLGPLRRLMPSPIQTNWRIYVRDPRTGHEGIYFVTNAVTNLIVALGARLFAEGMPMHLLYPAELIQRDGGFYLRLDPGVGNAPDAEAFLNSAAPPQAGPWSPAFATYQEMLAYCVPQDRAFSTQPWSGRTTRQEIVLGIPLTECEPLGGEVRSKAAEAIVGDAEPFCFRVPSVRFRFEQQVYDGGRP